MQVVLLLNQKCIGPLEAKHRVIKYAFGKTRLHVYRGDAVPVSNVSFSKAPDHASNKEKRLINRRHLREVSSLSLTQS